MSTGGTRDAAALRDGLARWVAAHPGLVPVPDLRADAGAGGPAPAPAPEVVGVRHAEGGMANETVVVETGPAPGGFVVRLPPLEPTFPDYELAPQALVQNAVAAAGVPAPSPAVVVDDERWIGSPFLAMPLLAGDIPGPAPAFDPYVDAAGPVGQRLLADGLLDTVAAVHAVPWQPAGLGDVLSGPRLHDAVERWAAYVAWASDGAPLPALSAALDWCERHVPAEREPVLLWGDVRLGNLVLDGERRVTGVLDWDLASIGPREMDLGWHLGLEFMMETLFGRRVPGFPGPADALGRYERLTGYEARDMAWHEVFALVRALAINDRHQRIAGDPRRTENPMGPVLLARLESAADES
ncbi:MAG TPA: phosphotransferase family protein [Acidimicrobiales bacterium]|nr:phosphotransferase family protein [Acidimicrobiales bacterium]